LVAAPILGGDREGRNPQPRLGEQVVLDPLGDGHGLVAAGLPPRVVGAEGAHLGAGAEELAFSGETVAVLARHGALLPQRHVGLVHVLLVVGDVVGIVDRKSTRLNSSHVSISYAVFCLKKQSTNHGTPAKANPWIKRKKIINPIVGMSGMINKINIVTKMDSLIKSSRPLRYDIHTIEGK